MCSKQYQRDVHKTMSEICAKYYVRDVHKQYQRDVKRCNLYTHYLQKGFPVDLTLDIIMPFFDQFGPTEHVQMRRDAKKQFKVNISVRLFPFHSLPPS